MVHGKAVGPAALALMSVLLALAVGWPSAPHVGAQTAASGDPTAGPTSTVGSTPTATPTARPAGRYGPGWRPPEPEGPPASISSVPATPGTLPFAAPSGAPAAAAAPVPGTAVPAADSQAARTALPALPTEPGAPAAGCDWHLAGNWSVTGAYTSGRLLGESYAATLSLRQFGSHVVGTQADESVTYYGRCTAATLDLEVWTGWDFIGRQNGSIAPDGQTIASTWALWSPESMEGRETLTGRARRLR